MSGRGEQPRQDACRAVRRARQLRQRELARAGQILGFGRRPPVDRGIVGQRAVRDLGHDGAVILHAHRAVGGDVADVDGVQVPLLEDPLDLGLAPLLHDEQHPLLRLRQHDLVGRHAGLALRHARHVDLDAGAAARSHLARRARQAGGPHVLNADERVGLHHLETGLEEQLLHERIADLHRRALLRELVVELRRRHRRAVNPVAARLGADVVAPGCRPRRRRP